MILEALILDMGEVLVRPQSPAAIRKMASLAGLREDEFVRRYWAHRDAYDGGLVGTAYWQRVLESGSANDAERIAELIAADCESWTDYRTEVWDMVARFKAAGGRTAMLSNGVSDIIAKVRRDHPLERYFDVVVVSCEVGCAKPDPAIYRLCLDRLGVRASSALFVDDRLLNLQAATEAGLQTFHFQGDESVERLRLRLA